MAEELVVVDRAHFFQILAEIAKTVIYARDGEIEIVRVFDWLVGAAPTRKLDRTETVIRRPNSHLKIESIKSSCN